MADLTLTIPAPLAPGDRCLLLPGRASAPPATALLADALPALRVGDRLAAAGEDCLTVIRVLTWPGEGAKHAVPGAFAGVLRDVPGGDLRLETRRSGRSLAWVTLSDKGSRGEREDGAGPLVAELVAQGLPLAHAEGFMLPDEEPVIRALLTDLALVQGFDLVITTGGTGPAPRDVTPEATLAVIEKRFHGLERAMTAVGLPKTPHAGLTRGVVGSLGRTLILNLPGSPKAVRESLEAVLPALGHCLDKLCGDPSDCARTD